MLGSAEGAVADVAVTTEDDSAGVAAVEGCILGGRGTATVEICMRGGA